MVEYEHSFTVSAGDIDQQGHVNNVRYVQWIQDVAVAHWRDLATPEQLEGLKQGRLYIQVHSERGIPPEQGKAQPDVDNSNLWGWLLK